MKIRAFGTSCTLVIFLLAGCSTTGGTIGGLGLPAPKFLKGAIKDNVYIAKDKSFSVAVPHKEGSNEYRYMNVKEQYSETENYVSFGPAAVDQSVYRVGTARALAPNAPDINLEEVAPRILDSYMQKLSNGYGARPQIAEMRRETIHGKTARYWKLIQVAPAGKFVSDKEVTLTHDFYVIDFTKAVAIVAVQTAEKLQGQSKGIGPRAFAESVMLYKVR